MQRTGGDRDNGEPLFPLLAPVQLALRRGRDALSGALAQDAGPGTNPRGKNKISSLARVVERSARNETNSTKDREDRIQNRSSQRGVAATKLIEQEATEITENLCSLR